LAQTAFINNSAEAPSSFGETNDDGIWVPKSISGLTFGTNGFFLDYKVAPGTGDGAGTDVSGEANHWTDSGLAANDQMLDTPTENYCTLNPIANEDFANAAYEEGSLQINSGTGTGYASAGWGTMGVTTGKWYFEQTVVSEDTGSTMHAGVIEISKQPTANAYRTYMSNGQKFHSTGGASSYGTAWADDDVIGIAIDLDGGDMWFSLNGTWQASATAAEIAGGDNSNAAFTDLNDIEWTPGVFPQTGTQSLNCGQQAFAGTPPTGFLKINETNLAEHFDWTITKGSDYFSATLYTGNATADTDINVGFDVTACLAVAKNRDVGDGWFAVDTVRGATKELTFEAAAAENTYTTGITAFGTVANNVRLGTGANGYNDTGEDFVMYAWQEGTTPGFDIVAYVGNNSGDPVIQNISHGLGVVPKFIYVKDRDTGSNGSIYHAGMATDPETDAVFLSSTSALHDFADYWNDTAPTTSVFTVGAGNDTNKNGDNYIAYVWAEVPGFSRFGHYIGNESTTNGPFIYCGFRPSFLIIKRADGAAAWGAHDTTRSPYNPINLRLTPNDSGAEIAGINIDVLSNGFKPNTNNGEANLNNARYIFSAWAENPFPRSKAR
jgi:hypothetical protein